MNLQAFPALILAQASACALSSPSGRLNQVIDFIAALDGPSGHLNQFSLQNKFIFIIDKKMPLGITDFITPDFNPGFKTCDLPFSAVGTIHLM